MTKRKAKRNARTSNAYAGFKISSKPIVQVTVADPAGDVPDSAGLPHVHTPPILFAIARDAHTIFASWNVDWQSVFQKAMPADRQVHLRVLDGGGFEQKRVAVEPMAATHYLTISGLHDYCHVEIGYFQPIDIWHSVAISNAIEIPPQGSAELTDVDLATIPFHLSFEQLVNLLGGRNGTPLARSVSNFQKRVLNSHSPNELSPTETLILGKLNLSLPEIVAARHDFEKSDSTKLARRTRALLRFTATSPSRGFEANSAG
jgi:Domain of unknown function (DUF4912)